MVNIDCYENYWSFIKTKCLIIGLAIEDTILINPLNITWCIQSPKNKLICRKKMIWFYTKLHPFTYKFMKKYILYSYKCFMIKFALKKLISSVILSTDFEYTSSKTFVLKSFRILKYVFTKSTYIVYYDSIRVFNKYLKPVSL